MENPAYIVYRLSDNLVMYVCEWNIVAPDGMSTEYGNWPKDIGARWLDKKTYRDSENNYRLTEDLRSADDNTLILQVE